MKNTTHFSSSLSLLASNSSAPQVRSRVLFLTAAMALLVLSAASSSLAGSATWKANPGSGDWNTATNWTPQTIPSGPSDTATFDTSDTTNIADLSGSTEVAGIVFNAGASAFTVTSFKLDITGMGITNSSGITQNFVTTLGVIRFFNSATAGNGTIFTNGGNTFGHPQTGFYDTSSAGSGTFINNGSAPEQSPGLTFFRGSSTAANGTFINNGGAANRTVGGTTIFDENATAANGTFTTNGGAPGSLRAIMDFRLNSTAANGTFITNGATVDGGVSGLITFGGSSAANGTFINNGGEVRGAPGASMTFFGATAGDATVILNGGAVSGAGGSTLYLGGGGGNATLIAKGDFGAGEGSKIVLGARGGTPQVGIFDKATMEIAGDQTVASLEGNGAIFLGARNLTVGSNHLSTVFSGKIQDEEGFNGGTGGSLTKIGTGKLVLSHRNTYTGGTTVKRGKLMVNNRGGSGTGSGPVHVDAGTLGGKGVIAGAVTVGTGSGRGAALSPGYLHGAGSPGALTIQSALTFNFDATNKVGLNSSNTTADEVVANGVTINGGAHLSFTDLGNGTLPLGTVFRVINNTAATPIAGNFSNLADGATFTNNGNSYQVDYQGGTGNDLTLTVVP